jgi:hypothetical protein
MKKTKRVKTPDNFYRTFDDGTVEVSLHRDSGGGDRMWRVSIWGDDDDYGLEKVNMSIDEVYACYRGIKDVVTVNDLKTEGLTNA